MNPKWENEVCIKHFLQKKIYKNIQLMMDFISYCDGNNTLIEISEKINVPIWDLYDLIENLKEKNNLIEVNK